MVSRPWHWLHAAVVAISRVRPAFAAVPLEGTKSETPFAMSNAGVTTPVGVL